MTALAFVLWTLGAVMLGWTLRSIVANKQMRELDAIIEGLRLVLARRDQS